MNSFKKKIKKKGLPYSNTHTPHPPVLSALLTGLGYQVGDDIVHGQWVGEKHSHGGVQAKAPPRVVILP